MADPISMFAVGSTIVGGITSGIGAMGSANASSSSYMYKAGIADLNAKIAKQNAAWAINSGGVKASQEGLKDAQEIGQTRATQGASGIDVGSGSHERVTDTQGDVARFDQGIIRSNASKTAYGYETQASQYTAEGNMDRAAASGSRKAGVLGLLSSIIGTAGSVASKWSQANTIGIGSKASAAPEGFDGNAPNWIY